MGYFSELSISMYESPMISELDTNVCSACVVDEALKKLVNDNLNSSKCDYCGVFNSHKKIAASFNIVMKRVSDSVLKEYSDAQDVDMPRVDGDWLENDLCIHDILEGFDPGWDISFLEDVVSCFDSSIYWVKHSDGDWSVSDPSEALIFGWNSFKNQVLNKTRYLFLAEPEDEFSSGRPDYIPIASMLNQLGKTCIRENMIKVIPIGTEFYRVRHARKGEVFTKFSEMGAPPSECASAGRINPGGIPYFYVSYQQNTAEKEVLDWSKRWYLAKYKTKLEISIVDLSVYPKIPSLFEPDLYQSRHNAYFLNSFIRDFIKPVNKDGKEHVEYVPTQIVAEFFRYNFKDKNGLSVKGIKYPSVKNNKGDNLAFFSSDNEEIENYFEIVEIIEFR